MLALCLATAVSVGLLLGGAIVESGVVPAYLLWNLFLAWVPFGLALWLQYVLRRRRWSSWLGLLLTAAWLAFLPNSFYMVSDFIHLPEVAQEQLLYTVVLFTSFIYTAVLLGISSVYIVHAELRQRLSGWRAAACIGVTLLLCSVAMYVGRDLRWNTWDVLFDPAGVLFDVSSRLLHPAQYGAMLAVIAPFFVLIASMYTTAWQGIRLFLSREQGVQ